MRPVVASSTPVITRTATYMYACTEWVEDGIAAPDEDHDKLLAVHEVLDRLAEIEPRKAEVFKLRFFIGLPHREAAGILGLSHTRADRAWLFAKAWLGRTLK